MLRSRTLAIIIAVAVFTVITLIALFVMAAGRKTTVADKDGIWYGFFYPGFTMPTTREEKILSLRDASRFQTLEECMDWGYELTGGNEFLASSGLDFTDETGAQELVPSVNDGFQCGLDCRYDESASDIACEQKV